MRPVLPLLLQVYRILVRYTSCVQPLSCDEALLDVTGLGDAQDIAHRLREEIHRTTGCTASAGTWLRGLAGCACKGCNLVLQPCRRQAGPARHTLLLQLVGVVPKGNGVRGGDMRIRSGITRPVLPSLLPGIGPSILVARLATHKGKPNGQHCVSKAQVMDFLADLEVDQLPGGNAKLYQGAGYLNRQAPEAKQGDCIGSTA